MSETVLVTPDTEEIEAKAAPVVAQARQVAITTADEHHRAVLLEKDLANRIRYVKDVFAEPKRKAHEAHKAITALEKKILTPMEEARRIVGARCTDYETEQERRAQAEAARLQAEAEAAEEERRIRGAAVLEESGDTAAAEEVLAAPVVTPVVHVAPQVATVEGTSKATRYSAEVVDLKALVLHVAERVKAGEDWWLSYLQPHGPNLNRAATSQREALAIPGVKVVAQVTRRVRSS